MEVILCLGDNKSHSVPLSCPPGFLGRYTVQPGDTFFNISQMFRVRLEALVVNNPHIPNPNLIFPGDVLCVPGLIRYPCCVVLRSLVRVPFGTGGIAFVNFAPSRWAICKFFWNITKTRNFW